MSSSNITYLTDVAMITCVVQKGHSEDILKAAREIGVMTGAFGYRARGTGIRERLGLLGIAVEAEREVISMLVSTEQQDLVFDMIYRAGKLDVPGMGYMYITPLEKASAYIPQSMLERLNK